MDVEIVEFSELIDCLADGCDIPNSVIRNIQVLVPDFYTSMTANEDMSVEGGILAAVGILGIVNFFYERRKKRIDAERKTFKYLLKKLRELHGDQDFVVTIEAMQRIIDTIYPESVYKKRYTVGMAQDPNTQNWYLVITSVTTAEVQHDEVQLNWAERFLQTKIYPSKHYQRFATLCDQLNRYGMLYWTGFAGFMIFKATALLTISALAIGLSFGIPLILTLAVFAYTCYVKRPADVSPEAINAIRATYAEEYYKTLDQKVDLMIDDLARDEKISVDLDDVDHITAKPQYEKPASRLTAAAERIQNRKSTVIVAALFGLIIGFVLASFVFWPLTGFLVAVIPALASNMALTWLVSTFIPFIAAIPIAMGYSIKSGVDESVEVKKVRQQILQKQAVLEATAKLHAENKALLAEIADKSPHLLQKIDLPRMGRAEDSRFWRVMETAPIHPAKRVISGVRVFLSKCWSGSFIARSILGLAGGVTVTGGVAALGVLAPLAAAAIPIAGQVFIGAVITGLLIWGTFRVVQHVLGRSHKDDVVSIQEAEARKLGAEHENRVLKKLVCVSRALEQNKEAKQHPGGDPEPLLVKENPKSAPVLTQGSNPSEDLGHTPASSSAQLPNRQKAPQPRFFQVAVPNTQVAMALDQKGSSAPMANLAGTFFSMQEKTRNPVANEENPAVVCCA